MRFALILLVFFNASSVQAEPVRVFAAASLKTVLDTAAQAWAGGEISFSYAGSGALARQVAAGAPADIVMLASADWMVWLAEQGAVQGTPVILAGNGLVLIAQAPAAPVSLTPDSLAGRLGAQGRLAMGDIRAVPAGIYGAEALRSLGLWEAVSARIAQTDNVRSALAFVARGEAALGLVYASDAVAEPRVSVVAEIPTRAHSAIVYPAALTPDAREGAAAFLAFLRSPEGRAFFQVAGFAEPTP